MKEEKPTSSPSADTPSSQPVVNETAQNTSPATQVPATKKRKKKTPLIIAIIVAAVLVLLGGGGALAYNLWYQNPDKVVHDAIINMAKAKTLAGTTQLTVKNDDFTGTLNIDGRSTSTEGMMNAKFNMEGQAQDGTELSFGLEGSAVFKNNALYVRLVNVQETVDAFMEASGVSQVPAGITDIIEKIDGQWVSIKASDFEELSGEDMSSQQECVMSVFEQLDTNNDMRQELVGLYRDNRIVVVDEKIGSERVGDVGSLGYIISIDTEAMKRVVDGMGDTAFGAALRECDDSIDFKEIAADMNTERSNEANESTTMELWVSRFGHEVTRFSVSGKTTDDTTDVAVIMEPVFNQDVTIEEPTDAIPVMEFMDDIGRAVSELSYGSQYGQGGSTYQPTGRTYSLN